MGGADEPEEEEEKQEEEEQEQEVKQESRAGRSEAIFFMSVGAVSSPSIC